MNKDLEFYARGRLLERLEQLPEANQRIFKLMYGRDNGQRSVPDTEAMDISVAVAEIPTDKLDWALEQVSRTFEKLNPAGVEQQ